jgi:spore photoproduct lyase
LINLIKNFIPKRIEYISLGVLRYTKRLKDIIIKNHPDKGDILYSNEFFPSVDKKFRYFKPLRIKIYKYLLDILKELDTYPYLCMEEDSIKKLLSLKESYFS